MTPVPYSSKKYDEAERVNYHVHQFLTCDALIPTSVAHCDLSFPSISYKLKISEILSRFERKGFKLVAIKVVVPLKDFVKRNYHDLSERPFFNGLCDFLNSGPVVDMVWEGEGVIKYVCKLIGATGPQKLEPPFVFPMESTTMISGPTMALLSGILSLLAARYVN